MFVDEISSREIIAKSNELFGSEHLKSFQFDQFGKINALIAFEAIKQSEKLFIGMTDKDIAHRQSVPLILLLASSMLKESKANFPEHFNPNEYVYASDNNKYSYVDQPNKMSLRQRISGGYRLRHFKGLDELLKYYFINKKHDCTVKPPRKLNDYQAYYSAITSSKDRAPSFFPEKILVICNKKTFKYEMQRLGFDLNMPYGEIVSSNTLSVCFSHSIDAPIIIASDYYTAKQYVDENPHFKFKHLIVSGGNEVSKVKALIKNDCNRGVYENCFIFGNFSIAKDNTFKLWHWNRHEEAFLSGKKLIRFNNYDVLDSDDMMPIQDSLNNNISDWIDEGNVYPHIKHVFRFILRLLGDKLNTIEDIDGSLSYCYNEMLYELSYENYDESDCEEHLKSLILDLKQLHKAKQSREDVLEWLKNNTDDINNIVVRNGDKKAWKEILANAQISLNTIIEEKEFLRRVRKKEAFGKYLITYVLRSGKLQRVINSIQSRDVSIRHLLYIPEAIVLNKRHKHISYLDGKSYSPKEKKWLKKYSVDIVTEDILNGLGPKIDRFEQFNMYDHYIDTSGQNIVYENMIIEVKDNDGNIEEKRISKKVLIRQDLDSEMENASVEELEEGQLVYLYENNSKGYLYDILSEESKIFIEIEDFARMWKYKLAHYLKDDVDGEKLLKLAKELGIENPQYIEKNWLQEKGSIKFPQTNKFRTLIYFLKRKGLMNDDDEQQLIRYKKQYAGAMISLGSNLSSEVQKIFREGDGDILRYVREHVINNNSEFKVLSKFDEETIYLLVMYNMKAWTFVRVVREEEDDD